MNHLKATVGIALFFLFLGLLGRFWIIPVCKASSPDSCRVAAYATAIRRFSLAELVQEDQRVIRVTLPSSTGGLVDVDASPTHIKRFLGEAVYFELIKRIVIACSVSAVLAGLLVWAMPILFRRRAKTKKSKFIRGIQFAKSKPLKPMPGQLDLAGVPIPRETETKHLAIAGATGVGKTQVISRMLRGIRSRTDRVLIMDLNGGYLSRFYREGDLVLNLFDERTVRWNPFADCRHPWDFDALAKATIPDGEGSDKAFNHYGQQLFSTVMRSMAYSGNPSVTEAIRLIGGATSKELAPYVSGTQIQILVQEEQAKMLGNTRAVISTYLQPWTYMQDGGEWSLRNWIRNGVPGSWLYVTYQDNQLAMLRQLLAAWLQIAIEETLSLDEDPERRLWFVADEFDSLGKVSVMNDALSKMRKYGGCCVLGFQLVPQLRQRYGHDGAAALLGNLRSMCLMGVPDPETACWCADAIGEQEYTRFEVSATQGKTNHDHSSSTSSSSGQRLAHVTERLLLPSQFQRLPDLAGYVRLSGDSPVYQVKIDHFSMPRRIKSFVPFGAGGAE